MCFVEYNVILYHNTTPIISRVQAQWGQWRADGEQENVILTLRLDTQAEIAYVKRGAPARLAQLPNALKVCFELGYEFAVKKP